MVSLSVTRYTDEKKIYIYIMRIAYWSSDRNDSLLLKTSIVEDNAVESWI